MPALSITLPRVPWLYEFPPMFHIPDGTPMVYGSTDPQEAMRSFGLDWGVVVTPLYIRRAMENFESVPSCRAILGGENWKLLGIVGGRKRVLKHEDFFSSISPSLEDDKLIISDGGCLYGGKIVAIRTNYALREITDDTIARVVFSMSYDSSRKKSALVFATNRVLGVEIPSGEIRMQSPESWEANVRPTLDACIDCAQATHDIATHSIPNPDGTQLGEYFCRVYQRRPGITTKRCGIIYDHLRNYYDPSFWLAMLAVCVLEDYKVYFSPQEQDRRTDQCLFGIGAKIKTRALGLAATTET